MPRNGAGTYSLPQSPFVPATTISSAAVNSDFSDIATALTQSVSADGQTPITGPIKFTAGTGAAPGMAFAAATGNGFSLPSGTSIGVSVSGNTVATFTSAGLATAGGSAITVPIGAVTDFAGSTAPTGWLLCFGQAISRTTYATLFTTISTTYGAGDGVTTFNLPDCRGRTTYGQDNMGGTAANRITAAGGNFDGTVLGNTGGQQNASVLQANLPNISLNSYNPGTISTNQSNIDQGGVFSNVGVAAGSNISAYLNANVPTQATASVTLPSYTPSLGGSGTALATLSNALIFNKIIFAGP